MALFNTWDGPISTEATNEFLTGLALAHLDRVRNPALQDAARTLENQLRAGDFGSVCNTGIDYGRSSPLEAIDFGQALAFFTKREDLDLGVDKEAAAWLKFQQSERLCCMTNHIFRLWGLGKFQFTKSVESQLFAAQRKIAHVLGDVPSLAELHFRFGPGASTQVRKSDACAKVKLSQKACCSEDLIPIAREVLEEIPGYTFPLDRRPSPRRPLSYFLKEIYGEYRCALTLHDESFEDAWYREPAPVDCEVHPGRLEFVPKNAKTKRVVLVEPWLNSVVQLAIGDHIARRLKRFGIDLTDQTKNKRLAREGSLTGALATLDLSSASDTISTLLVEHLVPPEWFNLLSLTRTGVYTYKGKEARFQKFSSMGNGYTFPLETLIFWALTRACCDDREVVSVYGDDIICPTHRVEAVLSVLNATGFLVNEEKSFWTGPFRESCGGDYLSGIDVRPCFIKGPMTGHDAFRLHNYYMRSGEIELATHVRNHIDDTIRLYGPDGFGDGVLIGYQWTPVRKADHLARGFGGAIFDTWCYSKRNFNKRLPGDKVLPGYTAYVREDESSDPLTNLSVAERRFMAWLINQDPDLSPSLYEMQGQRFTRNGVPENYLPGTKGCKRISIYTFQLP